MDGRCVMEATSGEGNVDLFKVGVAGTRVKKKGPDSVTRECLKFYIHVCLVARKADEVFANF